MNKVKVISVIAIAIIIFLGGYATGRIMHNKVSMEIRIGYQNSNRPNQIDYHHHFKNTDNQSIINNFIMIYMHKEKVNNIDLNVENPDIYIDLLSPTQSVGLIDSRLWFTNDGAIIGMRNGISWDDVEFYKIPESDASYIKEIIGYE